jgi:hypothetical protein
MPKVSITSEQIKSKRVFRRNDVTNIVVSNMSNTATTFIFQGIERKLPAVDISGIPVSPFQITDSGNHFDIELNFNAENNNLILDYTVLIINEEKC